MVCIVYRIWCLERHLIFLKYFILIIDKIIFVISNSNNISHNLKNSSNVTFYIFNVFLIFSLSWTVIEFSVTFRNGKIRRNFYHIELSWILWKHVINFLPTIVCDSSVERTDMGILLASMLLKAPINRQ